VPFRRVVAIDRVRFVGECVALAVAETLAQAYDAVGLIDIEYEVLPAVTDETTAIRENAPQLHENVPGNVTTIYKVRGGDYAKAAKEADQVVQLCIANNRLIPTCMETRSVIAAPEPDGTLTVYMPSQVPHMHRRWIAETTAIPENQLRVIAPDIGGGFGAKMHLYPEELLCPYLARELGVPVKWWESRSESHQSTSHGRAHTETIEVAIRNDGTILGMKVDTLGNVGAYLSNMASGGPTANTINFGTGNYKIANYEATSRVVVTNTVPVDAYRGYGRPEGAYIAERTIDAVARHLNIDQVEIRRKNFIQRADFPYRPYGSMGTIYDSGDYQGLLEKALAAFDYEARSHERETLRRRGIYRGIGVAAYTHMCGMAPSRRLAMSGFDRGGWESARVAIDSSGRATVYSGSMSQGHGHVTSLSQIAADVLQIPIENIDIIQGDTRQVQAGHGTFNSRSMAVGGSSLHVCSQRREGKEDRRRDAGGRRKGCRLFGRPVHCTRHRHRGPLLRQGGTHGLCRPQVTGGRRSRPRRNRVLRSDRHERTIRRASRLCRGRPGDRHRDHPRLCRGGRRRHPDQSAAGPRPNPWRRGAGYRTGAL